MLFEGKEKNLAIHPLTPERTNSMKIIKRDGSIEDFNPQKVNSWAQWATVGLKGRVDWSRVVMESVKVLGETSSSQELQRQLIKKCLEHRTWPYNAMAGKLYTALIRKEIYGDAIPTVKVVQAKLLKAGLIRKMNYDEADFEHIESIIRHERDFNLAHFQIHQIRKKYSLQDRVTKQEFETPQFVYMRMAMALAEDELPTMRMVHLEKWYEHFSFNRINAPTPNYMNLGTKHNGYASCCLYTVDDSAPSLAIGDHIAYTMTYMSAGIGGNLNTRSVGDGVRNGSIVHQGKLPYFRSLGSAIHANLQGGRGGACTTYFSCFDPEAMTIINLQNPRTVRDKQNRDIHFAIIMNRFFAMKVAKNENIFTFNVHTAKDLNEALYSGDTEAFRALYAKYDADVNFVKNYVSAREILLAAGQQSFEVATLYYFMSDEANRHTPFKEKIYSSNLCLEITEPTIPYTHMMDLYSEDDHGRGEVALCSLAAIVEPNIKSEDEYASAAYYALKMIDKCIHMSDYIFPHVGFTAKQRMNAGVGLTGIAYSLAKLNLRYDEASGRQKLHDISERHAFHLISQSLKLGQELGNAPWIKKTKWAEGWLPLDTYKKAVDELVPPTYRYDWETLRLEIIKNGGIRNSALIAHMPVESSSKASGGTNGVYPMRDLFMKKSDAQNVINWCATDDDLYGEQYQSAWDIKSTDLIKAYAVIQKFTDQSISADLYADRSVTIDITTDEIIETFLAIVKYGIKSRYYQNSKTSNQPNSNSQVTSAKVVEEVEEIDTRPEARGCADGACAL
jgi:ribonucleoside-diphosphate reductase alpha chain